MPIIDIEIVCRAEEALPDGMASTLADSLGEVFAAEPGKVWVRVRALSETFYAENLSEAPRPVFVTVLTGVPLEGEILKLHAEQITAAVSDITHCARENVHVLFEPAARGRIAFGGQLVE